MLEFIISFLLLIIGICAQDGQVLIASGLFSIACNLSSITDVIRKKVE